MKIAIIKYNAGNIRSVDFALKRLGIEASITDDHAEIIQADKVIFPGVGEASTTMSYLRDKGLDTVIKGLKQPVLGICLGPSITCCVLLVSSSTLLVMIVLFLAGVVFRHVRFNDTGQQ